MMKSSTLFERGPLPLLRLPDIIQVIGVAGLPRISHSSASVYYTEQNPKNKTGKAWERGCVSCQMLSITNKRITIYKMVSVL